MTAPRLGRTPRSDVQASTEGCRLSVARTVGAGGHVAEVPSVPVLVSQGAVVLPGRVEVRACGRAPAGWRWEDGLSPRRVRYDPAARGGLLTMCLSQTPKQTRRLLAGVGSSTPRNTAAGAPVDMQPFVVSPSCAPDGENAR